MECRTDGRRPRAHALCANLYKRAKWKEGSHNVRNAAEDHHNFQPLRDVRTRPGANPSELSRSEPVRVVADLDSTTAVARPRSQEPDDRRIGGWLAMAWRWP